MKHGGWLDLEGKGQENSRRPKEASQFWLSPWVDDDAIYLLQELEGEWGVDDERGKERQTAESNTLGIFRGTFSSSDRGREWLTRETEMQQLFQGEGVRCF